MYIKIFSFDDIKYKSKFALLRYILYTYMGRKRKKGEIYTQYIGIFSGLRIL